MLIEDKLHFSHIVYRIFMYLLYIFQKRIANLVPISVLTYICFTSILIINKLWCISILKKREEVIVGKIVDAIRHLRLSSKLSFSSYFWTIFRFVLKLAQYWPKQTKFWPFLTLFYAIPLHCRKIRNVSPIINN